MVKIKSKNIQKKMNYKMVTAQKIATFLDKELNIKEFEDTCCNGLQVDNCHSANSKDKIEIKKIGFAVDAALEVFEKAKEKKCNMVITHHGMIWNWMDSIVGREYGRIKYLIENKIALYSAHLPLDQNEKYGNNICLAKFLKLKNLKEFGKVNNKKIGFIGDYNGNLNSVKKILKEKGMRISSLDFGPTEIKKIAIVSGGGANSLGEAVECKSDLFITGESAHHNYHNAKEEKLNMIFSGHYETEIWGVKELMNLIKKKFNVEVEFIDVPVSIPDKI